MNHELAFLWFGLPGSLLSFPLRIFFSCSLAGGGRYLSVPEVWADRDGGSRTEVLSCLLSGPVRDTPPYRAIPFRDSIAEGGIAPICLFFIGYRAGIAEIPLLRGGIAPSLRMLSKGGNAQKRGRGYRTQLAMLRHQKPHSAQ